MTTHLARLRGVLPAMRPEDYRYVLAGLAFVLGVGLIFMIGWTSGKQQRRRKGHSSPPTDDESSGSDSDEEAADSSTRKQICFAILRNEMYKKTIRLCGVRTHDQLCQTLQEIFVAELNASFLSFSDLEMQYLTCEGKPAVVRIPQPSLPSSACDATGHMNSSGRPISPPDCVTPLNDILSSKALLLSDKPLAALVEAQQALAKGMQQEEERQASRRAKESERRKKKRIAAQRLLESQRKLTMRSDP